VFCRIFEKILSENSRKYDARKFKKLVFKRSFCKLL
jgi:hypothetical protein